MEIGKTLQDMAIDDDDHIGEEAYKPFRHYASDFVIRYWEASVESINKFRKIYKAHYDANETFYEYNYSHPYNRPGNIPLAKLQTHLSPLQVVTEIQKKTICKFGQINITESVAYDVQNVYTAYFKKHKLTEEILC